MGSLAARFREVEVTLPQPAAPQLRCPATWLNPQHSASVFRFVDCQYDPDGTAADIRRLFGEASQIAVNPMPLRAIFVALAKSSRKAA
jgi:hypothetical protein